MNSKKTDKELRDLPNYDFLGSIYYKTNKQELSLALSSIASQIYKPKNVIIVADGPLQQQTLNLISKYSKSLPIKFIELQENKGLGTALKEGLNHCESTIVLRFDSDDFNIKERAYIQVSTLVNFNIDIVSSYIFEFEDDYKKPIRRKKVPLNNKEIKKQIFRRNPINHPAAAFFKKSIDSIGGYRHCPFYEDYDLWIRAFLKNLKFKNIEKELVGMKVSDQINRRHGFNLIKGEFYLLKTFLKGNFIYGIRFFPFFLIRIILLIIPIKLLDIFYKKILR